MVKIVGAMSTNHVIGYRGKLPWRSPADLAHFKALTEYRTIVMGRKTFDSLSRIPLPFRDNVVLSQSDPIKKERNGLTFVNKNLDTVISDITKDKPHEDVWIIGGSTLYQAGLDLADECYLTIVDVACEGDAFFPYEELTEKYKLMEKKKPIGLYSGPKIEFTRWVNKSLLG